MSRYAALLNQAKDFSGALDVLRAAVARDPRNAPLKVDLIRVQAEVDGVDVALAKAREFAGDDPDNSLYKLASAELYEQAGRAKDALALLEKAAAAQPSDDALAVALSRLYTRIGDFAKAEAVLTGRLKTDPKNSTLGSALAPLYLTTGRPDDAKKIYSDLLLQRPSDVAALVGLAEIAIGQAKWSEATDYVTRAQAAAPNDPAPGLALIRLDISRQDWKGAATAAAQLAEKFPTNFNVLDAKGRAQIETGDMEGAVSTYKRAYELAPASPPALSRYLAVLIAAKNFPAAQSLLQAALVRDPRNASLKGDLIRVAREIGGLDAGLAMAKTFADSDPDNSLYDLVSAELYEKAGRGADAVDLLEKAVAARPSDRDLTIALSRVYARTGVPTKAEAVLRARLEADPKEFVVRSVLAGFYLEQKQYDAAIAEYTRLVADRPADAPALNNLAWLYQLKGDLAKARELAERAFAAAPRAPSIDDTLGWILLAQGEADKAMPYLNAASSAAPGNPNIRYHLAVALHRVGRTADARAMLEKLLGSGAAFADKADAEKLLQDLKRG